MIFVAIGACEVAFWMFLLAGLVLRYAFRRRRLSGAVLLLSPATDLALLVLVAVDLSRGAAPTSAHALAACYLAFTVAFGPSLIRWVDGRYAHRFAGGPAPAGRPKAPRVRFRYECADFGRAAAAYGMSIVLLSGLALLIGDFARAKPLFGFVPGLTIALIVWLAVGPVPAALGLLRARRG